MKHLKDSPINQSWKCSCCYVGIWIILQVAMLPMYYSQTITNKPAEGAFQCPGQVLVFTCETRASSIITWRSAEYIGPNRLQFSDGRSVGDEEPASETVATLTRNNIEGGERVLESQLRITVANISSSSITCARDNGTADSITLRVLLVATGEVHVISDQRKNSAGGCVVHFSWGPPSDLAIRDISHYKIAINGTPINDERNISKGFSMRSHPVCPCGTHNISITTVNLCNGMGPTVTKFVDYPETEEVCEVETGSIANSYSNGENETKSRLLISGLIIVSIIGGLLLIVSVALLVLLILVCYGVIPICQYPNKNGNGIHEMQPTNDDEKKN